MNAAAALDAAYKAAAIARASRAASLEALDAADDALRAAIAAAHAAYQQVFDRDSDAADAMRDADFAFDRAKMARIAHNMADSHLLSEAMAGRGGRCDASDAGQFAALVLESALAEGGCEAPDSEEQIEALRAMLAQAIEEAMARDAEEFGAADAAERAARAAATVPALTSTPGEKKMNIASILSSACAAAGLDPLAWGQISVADLIAARAGVVGALPANVSFEALFALERGLREAAESRAADVEEMLIERDAALEIALAELMRLRDAAAELEAALAASDIIADAGSPVAAVARAAAP